jgi:hypothetical protein
VSYFLTNAGQLASCMDSAALKSIKCNLINSKTFTPGNCALIFRHSFRENRSRFVNEFSVNRYVTSVLSSNPNLSQSFEHPEPLLLMCFWTEYIETYRKYCGTFTAFNVDF